MLSIGQFAQATDLTVKALRHYDERGLLTPAKVDPYTRHRTYGGAQIRDAVLIKALRAAGVPVEAVRRALDEPGTTRDVIAGFRAEVSAARAAQDAAMDGAEYLATALEKAAPVVEREVPHQHYAAVVIRIPADGSGDDAREDDRANEAFGALFGALTRLGNPPIGPFWTGIDAVEGDPETVELSLCWPTAHPVGDGVIVDGAETRTGTLPARRELVARWLYSDDDGDGAVPPGLPHPAFVALLGELARRAENGGGDPDEDMNGIRQIGVMGDEGAIGIDLAIALG